MSIPERMAVARIKNLTIDAVIGCNDWERTTRQKIVINIELAFDAAEAIATDSLERTMDYRALKKKIIASVQSTSFNLLEALTAHVLGLVLEEGRVVRATVTIDKPKALRFADSVSITLSGGECE